MNYALRILFFLILIGSSFNLYQKTKIVQEKKSEIRNYNFIKYGLLNPEKWKGQFSTILNSKIDSYQFNFRVKEDFFAKSEINLVDELKSGMNEIGYIDIYDFAESKLYDLIDNIREENSGLGINACLNRLDEQVPLIAEKLNSYINENRDEIFSYVEDGLSNVSESDKQRFQKLILNKINNLIDKNRSKIQSVIKKTIKVEIDKSIAAISSTNKIDIPSNPDISEEELFFLEKEKSKWRNITLLIILIGMAGYFFLFENKEYPIFDITAFSLITLALGVFLPMITLEAEIEKIGITVLGSEILFENQMIVYRSKSIYEFFGILFNKGLNIFSSDFSGGLKLIIVSTFILLFSVIFPIIKILSGLYLNFKKSSFLEKLINNLGKWSMADVFVVALVLAFLGFNGLIDDQLNNISYNQKIITNNNSSLEPGFYLFLFYCFISLIFKRQTDG